MSTIALFFITVSSVLSAFTARLFRNTLLISLGCRAPAAQLLLSQVSIPSHGNTTACIKTQTPRSAPTNNPLFMIIISLTEVEIGSVDGGQRKPTPRAAHPGREPLPGRPASSLPSKA